MNKQDMKVIEQAVWRMKLVEEVTNEQRRQMQDDLDFYTGDQWPASILKQRQLDCRPALVINKLPAYVRQVVNDIRQMRPGIKVKAVDSQADPRTANMLTGMIRAIEQDSNAESAYDWAAECAVKIGIGYWRIITEYDEGQTFDQVVRIKRIRDPFSVYIDPYAEEQDASDMRFALVETWIPKNQFETRYPNAKAEWQGGDDSPGRNWYRKDAVRVAEYWTVEEEQVDLSLMPDGRVLFGAFDEAVQTRKMSRRVVRQYLLTAQEVLDETVWPGQHIPIIRVVGVEELKEGRSLYKGMVHDLIDSQRQYNYMRSASAERVALAPRAPFIGPRGAFSDPKWKYANVKNYPYLEYDGNVMPQRQPGPDASPGLIAEAEAASEELKSITGIHDAALGAPSNEISGLAISRRKVESDISNFHYMDNLAKAMRYSGRVLVELIPQIYRSGRIVKILGIDGQEQTVPIGQQTTDETGKPVMYNLDVGRYNVVVDVGPSYTTQREETVETLLEFLKIRPDAGELVGDIIARNLDLPESEELAKRFRAVVPPEVLQGENPQIAAIIQQNQQQVQQLTEVVQQLQTALNVAQTKLADKEKELLLKEREIERKYLEQYQDFVAKIAEMELKYQQTPDLDIPEMPAGEEEGREVEETDAS